MFVPSEQWRNHEEIMQWHIQLSARLPTKDPCLIQSSETLQVQYYDWDDSFIKSTY